MLIKSLSAVRPSIIRYFCFFISSFQWQMQSLSQCKLFVQSVVDSLFTFSQQNHCQLWDWFFDWFVDQLCADQQLPIFWFSFLFLTAYIISFTILSAIFLNHRCTGSKTPLIRICSRSVQQILWFMIIALDLSRLLMLLPLLATWSVQTAAISIH